LIGVEPQKRKLSGLTLTINGWRLVMREELSVGELDLSKPITVVTFHADWCAPCKAFAPVLDEVSEIFNENVSWVKVNVDTFPAIAQKYGVRGIPTTLIFKKETVEKVIVGKESKSEVMQKLTDAVGVFQ
jgi:thioredoxin 1